MAYITNKTKNVIGTSLYIDDAIKDGILYEGVNNITQTNNDLPFILDLTYYTNENEYYDIIYSQETKNKIKILFNNVELEDADEYCESFEVISRVIPTGSKTFMLSNLVSKEATLILHNIDPSIIQDQVSISIGTVVGSTSLGDTYEYVPIGIFNIQEKPTTDKDKTTIKLRDNSVKLDFDYNAKPLIDSNNGSATKLQILNDICTQAGIINNVSSFLGDSDGIGIYDNTITARQYVSWLAEQAGAMPIITRNGELDFKYLNNLTTYIVPIDVVEKYENGDNFKISRVVYESGAIKYENGNETYDTLFLDSANPYISTQEQVDNIYNIVNNFEINSFETGRILGNPAIDHYDLIQITDDNATFTTFANNILRYNGKLTHTFDSKISLERKTENVTKNSTQTFKKYAKTEIDNLNGTVEFHTGEINTLNVNSNQTAESISTISNRIDTLQSSTSFQINAINEQIENGVEKLTNSLVTIDVNGIKTSRDNETFNTQITNKTFEVKDRNKPLAFIGYKDSEQRTVAQIDDLESARATIGVHRCETLTRNNKKRTAWFYVGGGS